MSPSLDLKCHESLPFSVAMNLEFIQSLFLCARPCHLRQSWLLKPESDFLPGTVRIVWSQHALFVFAEFTDTNAFTLAKNHNDLLWRLGDVCEIFLRPIEQDDYFEFHVAPNNLRLQLHFKNVPFAKKIGEFGLFENALMPENSFTSTTWLRPEINRWSVLAEIPLKIFRNSNKSLNGSEWLFSVCRYDYIRGMHKSVISSTSAHTHSDFHRQHEWGKIRFLPA